MKKIPSNQEEDLPILSQGPNSKKVWGNSPPPRLGGQARPEEDFELEESFDSADVFEDEDDDSTDSGARSPAAKTDGKEGMFLTRTKSGTFQPLLPRQSSPTSPKPFSPNSHEHSNPDSEVKSLDEEIGDFDDDFELESPAASPKPEPSSKSGGGFSRIDSKAKPSIIEEEDDDYDDNFDDFEEVDESSKEKHPSTANRNDDLMIEDDLDDLSVGEDFDQSDEW